MEQGYLEQQAEKSGESLDLGLDTSSKSAVNNRQTNQSSAKPPTKPERGAMGTPGRRSSGGGGGVRKGNRGGAGGSGSSPSTEAGGGAGRVRSTSPGSPPMGFSPLPPKHAMVSTRGVMRGRKIRHVVDTMSLGNASLSGPRVFVSSISYDLVDRFGVSQTCTSGCEQGAGTAPTAEDGFPNLFFCFFA